MIEDGRNVEPYTRSPADPFITGANGVQQGDDDERTSLH